MPFAFPPANLDRQLSLPPSIGIHKSVDTDWTWECGIFWNRDQLFRDPTLYEMQSFRVGGILYRLPRPLLATFEPPVAHKLGRFIVNGLETYFVGRGKTVEEAREDWEGQIDFSIQQLLAVQDFERTEEQQKQWHLLCRYFDMNEIRYSNPLKIRAYGRLLSTHSREFRIRFIDGEKVTLSRTEIADEMVRFLPGQPFEAVVLRDPRTWKLIRIESAFPTSLLPQVTEEEANEILAHCPAISELEWDE